MNHRILIVDDERRTLLLMERALRDLQDEHEDIEILTASDGEQALQLIEAEQPALVYLDVMMPRVDGLNVCKTVKASPDMQDVYIVMLTAMGQEGDRQNAKQAGADLYLTKPFDPDKVLKIAKEVLSL
ncbi:MAG: response regulator [Chloroflexota bacterium]|nr:MAG: response regulator [Chloroflexota bacterium]